MVNSNLYEQGLLDGDKRTREIYRLMLRQCIEDFEKDGIKRCADVLREKFSMVLEDDGGPV